jgi:hypothetical protein
MRIYIEIKRDADPRSRAEQPVQAHGDADRRSTPTCSPWSTGSRRRCRSRQILLHYIEFRREVVRRRTEFDLEEGPRSSPHLGRPQDRPRQPGRGHPHHPRVGRRRGRASDHLRDPLRAERDPGYTRSWTCSSGPTGRPGTEEDRGGIPGGDQAHRRAGGHPRQSFSASSSVIKDELGDQEPSTPAPAVPGSPTTPAAR